LQSTGPDVMREMGKHERRQHQPGNDPGCDRGDHGLRARPDLGYSALAIKHCRA